MRTRSILLSAILMAAITPAFAQATDGMQGMQMGQNAHNMQKNGAAQGTGVIEAIDTVKGTVTISIRRSRQSIRRQ